MSDLGNPNHGNGLQPLKIEEQKRKRTFRQNVQQHFKNYCKSTTIHGFAYFGEDRTLLEYIWWFVIFSLGISCAVYMIYEIYMKWVESPVIVSFATKRELISQIPFPAVTICPLTKINKKFFNLTAYKEKDYDIHNDTVSDEMDKIASYMGVLCGHNYSSIERQYLDEDFFSVTQKNKIELRGLIIIGGKTFSLDDVTRFTVTVGGICWTLNRFSLDEIYKDIVVRHQGDLPDFGPSTWDPATGKRASEHMSSAYPRRLIAPGLSGGITIFLFEDAANNDLFCNPLFVGYTVHLNYPSQVPTNSDPFFVLPASDVVLVSLDASMVNTSATVKKYNPDKRDCYFQNEKQLKYFKYYTSKNCDLECLTNATLRSCECVQYFMPRENGTKICGRGKNKCVQKVAYIMATDQTEVEEIANMGTYSRAECGCMPSCTEITYSPTFNTVKTNQQQVRALMGDFFENLNETYQYSSLIMYYQSDRITSTERNELYGPRDFISNFGGLLGLFTGFSILSFMEIIYFLSIRFIGNIQLYGHWAGPSD